MFELISINFFVLSIPSIHLSAPPFPIISASSSPSYVAATAWDVASSTRGEDREGVAEVRPQVQQ